MRKARKVRHIILALVLPFLLHGTYNYILTGTNWAYVLVPFMLGLWMLAMRRVKTASALSRHNDVVPINQFKNQA
ncbi:hypothetical protein JNUCC1_03641 [Lentibacillus sp. JNUCC-1]|nr:hypothetical protein [Lentibacillus sp. JNUCC-1]